MMKNIKYIVLSLLLTLGACDNVDFGSTNENPNGAGEPYTAGLMAGAMSRFSTLTGREYLMKPTLLIQYQSQVTYTDEMRYGEVASSWYSYYVQTLSNLQLVVDICSDPDKITPALITQGNPTNQIAVAKIFQAVIFKRVTDTWGNIPYSEALKGLDLISPKYDNQEDIYKALIASVKDSRDMLLTAEKGPIGDNIYGGNVVKWKKFANSLILQMTLQLSKKYPSAGQYAAIEFNAALNNAAGVITTVADEAWFTYTLDFQNPFVANRIPDYFLSKEFTDGLKGLGTTTNNTLDARINVFARYPDRDGVPYGFQGGSGTGKTGMSLKIWNNIAPLPLMTAAYTYLNRAEAGALGWTSEVPATMLTNGITLSYATLDAHYATTISSGAAAYAAARVATIAGTVTARRVIAEEKWVALFPSGFDAWAEWRRTNYPTLFPATDFLNNGQIPRRYIYPTEESSLNAAAYASGVSSLSPATDNNTSKVWWDQ